MVDKDSALKKVGNNIRRYRELKGMTLEELAIKCGYNPNSAKSSMSKIERGENDLPTQKLKLIADVLEIEPSCLLSDTPSALEQSDSYFISLFNSLDSSDQQRIIGRMELLLENEKYRKKEYHIG